MILEQPARSIEGIANRDMRVLMGMVGAWISPDDDLATRDGNGDVDSEQLALLVMAMPGLDNDPTRDDPVKKSLQFLGAMADPRFQRGRGVHVTEGDLYW